MVASSIRMKPSHVPTKSHANSSGEKKVFASAAELALYPSVGHLHKKGIGNEVLRQWKLMNGTVFQAIMRYVEQQIKNSFHHLIFAPISSEVISKILNHLEDIKFIKNKKEKHLKDTFEKLLKEKEEEGQHLNANSGLNISSHFN